MCYRDRNVIAARHSHSVSRAGTKKHLIHEALKELIRLRKRKDLTELAGSIKFHKGFDHKKFYRLLYCPDSH
ncbi:MAG: type II toxin-antitoxin system VapB family antitoxin [Deltaproteobacteria bacterium]|nr:type II toxin-antitoxin system VapB family antitoxin [Deltaproteobacteria bacterium]